MVNPRQLIIGIFDAAYEGSRWVKTSFNPISAEKSLDFAGKVENPCFQLENI